LKKKYKLSEKLRYGFDRSMAAGPIALIGWLTLVSLFIIVTASGFMALTGIAPEGSQKIGFLEGMWESLMRTMDAGTMGGDVGWPYRFVSLFITLAGIFVFSALIGILSAGIDAKLNELRKGRSRIIEQEQTVILNWSSSIFDIIREIVIANTSRRRPSIVIMANKDKIEMEDEIKNKIEHLANTRVICRTGDPTDLFDLDIVSPDTCRSVIILSPETESPDSQTIKTVLALVNHPRRRTDKYQIAAEIRDAENVEVARAVGGDELQIILADDLISRIVVQSSRQSGLSAVYTELLDFDGCEIYTLAQPEITGKSFGEVVASYETSAPIGILDKDGTVILNPNMRRDMLETDKLIIIAEDDASIALAAPIEPNEEAIIAKKGQKRVAEHTLIIGWNRRGNIIAHELSKYVAPNSKLVIAADTPELRDNPTFNVNKNLSVELKITNTNHRASLDNLDIASFDNILVLGYSDNLEAQMADTTTLITLLHIRKISEDAGKHISVVSEMIDIRNRELAEVTRADDFVVSNKLVSLMLAQASENRSMAAIFDELLDEDGSEIYLRPICDYVDISQPLNFYTLLESAKRRGEVAIGYRRIRKGNGADDRNMGGVVINPKKSEILEYIESDRIIVLAED